MSEPWARMPLSAPVWLWLVYAATVLGLGVMAHEGFGFTACILTAAYSFQFWTFAAHRGQQRRETKP